jgi:serine/threonine protein kinase
MNIKLDGEKYNNVDPQAMDLLRRMLLSNPAERVSAAQALSHPFFEDCMNLFEQNEKSLNSPCLTKVSEKRHYK